MDVKLVCHWHHVYTYNRFTYHICKKSKRTLEKIEVYQIHEQ